MGDQENVMDPHDPPGKTRILVAGIGNMFLRDDGFGPEVARRLHANANADASRDGVRVVDYGIRGMHLVYDLLDGVDVLVLIDAIPSTGAGGNGQTGSIRVLRIRPEDVDGPGAHPTGPDAHGMDPLTALSSVRALGGELPLTYLVGCVASDTDDGIGLSAAVAAAIPEAISAVHTILDNHSAAARGG